MPSIQLYLTIAEKLKIDPNFYTSLPYLEISGAEVVTNEHWIWLQDQEWMILSPLPLKEESENYPMPKGKVWSTFSNFPIEKYSPEFLDYQYIFDSRAFNDLSGGNWVVFRKNIRKFPKRHQNWRYDKVTPTSLVDLLWKWSNPRMSSLQDVEFIFSYVLNPKHKDIYRKAVYDETGNVISVNVWDENWKYINYRFCISDPEISFLDEFSRYLFYTDPKIQSKNKLVNDGGVLDSPGLERFKDKLNPLNKSKIYTIII